MPEMKTRLDEGIRYERGGALELALECYEAVAAGAKDPYLVAEALRHQASVFRTRCDWPKALAAARQSAESAKNADLPNLFAEALNAEALVHQSRGHFEDAARLYHEILRESRDDRMRGIVLQNLASMAAAEKDFDRASRLFLDSATCFERAGYERGRVIALTNCAAAALDSGDIEGARDLGCSAVEAARELGDLDLLGIANLNHAEALAKLGDLPMAEAAASAALGHFTLVENTWRCVHCIRLLADIFETRGDLETAARAIRRGHEMAVAIGAEVETKELQKRLDALAAAQPKTEPPR
jgi:tetratricopeptide (TPR) repeat protein